MDQADIMQKAAIAIRSLIDAGFDPDAATKTLLASDLGRLVGQHTGLYSVQLQPPGTTSTPIPSEQGATP